MVTKTVSPEKKKISSLYIEVLKELGLNPELDEDGDIEFDGLSNNGYKLLAIIDEDHEEFVRISLPGLARLEESERVKMLEACNYANLKSKGAKVYIGTSGKYVWAAYEVIIDKLSKDVLMELIEVSSAVLDAASIKFSSYLRDNA
ncbi:YbjN domain-containing protein [Metapseudomonas otitidis]|uniref:YbjN domain-containing protein n=1 Tax=Metapseudomonas otitidis TaxID=319939 RepID=UPI003CF98517